MACKCYHAERNFLGKIGVCWGTKECEACSCGGDESKCDFYEDKRKRTIPKTTNADRIRAMSDEELAEMHVGVGCPPGTDLNELCFGENGEELLCTPPRCRKCWLKWLKQEATND